jgi:ATP-dependent Clp protease protease subunit
VTRKLDGELSRVYAKNTGKTQAAAKKLMDAETWMTGEEAVKEGFATSASADKAEEATAFDYRSYKHAPQQLVALANAKGWRPLAACLQDALASAGRNPRGESAQHRQEEDPMTTATPKTAADEAAEKLAADQKAAAEKAQADAIEKAKADATKRAADITAACALAGVTGAKVTEYINSNKALGDIVAELQAEKAKADAAEVNGRPKNGTGASALDPETQKKASASWDKHVEAQNKRIPQSRVA